MSRKVRYFPEAKKDIKHALKWSVEAFGKDAAVRYKELISKAISEIVVNPDLDHFANVQGFQDSIRIYHLKHSRQAAAVNGKTVKNPRHFVVYQMSEDVVTIVRVLHERMQILEQLRDTL